MFMAEYDWGAEVRAFRLRKKMKQEAVAAHLGVSQAYISRLEAGMIDPLPEIRERIETLLHTRENRPHFDHWLATVRHSNALSWVVRREAGCVEIVEISPSFQHLDGPLAQLKPGACLLRTLGGSIAGKLEELESLGAFDGKVQAVEGIWAAADGDRKHYFHSVSVPVRDDLGNWYIHSTNEVLDRDGFDRKLNSGDFPRAIDAT